MRFALYYRLSLALLLLSLCLTLARAQCPAGNVDLLSQAQVDSFSASCVNFPGNLNISGSDITSLTALRNLQYIGGQLDIGNNASLSSLAGLSSLTAVGGDVFINNNASLSSPTGLSSLLIVGGALHIDNNDAMTSLTGLSSLTAIGGFLEINDNNALSSLTGMSSLTSLSSMFITLNPSLGSMAGLNNLRTIERNTEISNNASLSSLSGLSSLTIIGNFLAIQNNGQLTSLTGLSSLITIGGFVDIRYNPQLSQCAIEAVCRYLTNPSNYILMSDNAPGCATRAEVEANCNYSAITRQPPSQSIVCTGATVTASVSTTGNATAYQWYKDSFASPVVSQTTATLSLSNVSTNDVGSYSVVVSGGYYSLTSTAFSLTVNTIPNPTVFTQTTPNGLLVQVSGGADYERLKSAEQLNGYQIRQSEINQTGYFLITQPGPYSITAIGANGCRAVVTGTR